MHALRWAQWFFCRWARGTWRWKVPTLLTSIRVVCTLAKLGLQSPEFPIPNGSR